MDVKVKKLNACIRQEIDFLDSKLQQEMQDNNQMLSTRINDLVNTRMKEMKQMVMFILNKELAKVTEDIYKSIEVEEVDHTLEKDEADKFKYLKTWLERKDEQSRMKMSELRSQIESLTASLLHSSKKMQDFGSLSNDFKAFQNVEK